MAIVDITLHLYSDDEQDMRALAALAHVLCAKPLQVQVPTSQVAPDLPPGKFVQTAPVRVHADEKPVPEPASAPAEVAPAAAKAEPVAPAKPATAEAGMTLDDVRAVMRETLRLTGPNPVQAVFRKAKIEQVSDLKPAMFASFVADLVAARTAAGGAK